MNVKLAAQTLSLSVADAIEFLDSSMKLTEFCNSRGTVNLSLLEQSIGCLIC
jgi:hypothetical protein